MRNVLIGVIVLVIAVSSCVALSIREAASSAKEKHLEDLEITAQISLDRQSMMKDFSGGNPGEFDRESMKEMLTNQNELTLDELEIYAKAESVKGFYYTASTSVNTDDNWEAVDTTGISREDTESDIEQGGFSEMGGPGGRGGMFGGGMPGRMGNQGDATIVGYSSDEAMVEFVAGTSTITNGEMFEEGTEEYHCVISDELATYNELEVGNTLNIVNPNNEEESYELEIVGIYHNEQSGTMQPGMMGGFSTATDSANQIYMSYNALSKVLIASEEAAAATKEADEETEVTALASQMSGTYTFATIEDYEDFDAQARELGLAEEYTISTGDITSYEESLEPLNDLSDYAMYFFTVILIIGGIVLAVLNVFNIRERKYEIGVLAAIGMKKWKIAVQYTTELLVVTFVAIFIGAGIGTASSVPITNALLAKQIESQEEAKTKELENFGRMEMPGNIGGPSGMPSGMAGKIPNSSGDRESGMNFLENMSKDMTNYVEEINSATNLTVIIQLMGVGVLLTLISSAFAITFVLRYDPLKIMANRD